MKKYFTTIILIFQIVFVAALVNTNTKAQNQRNPVLEECTGTWCVWCPCGHDIMEGILHDMPNAIMIGYHGPPGSSDPWDNFPGNQIIGLMNYSGYPTAVIDRTGPPMSRGQWPGVMNQRYDVPATVNIETDKSFNQSTFEFDATISVTPTEDLEGDYNFTVILLEDSLIYQQSGNGSCPGGNNYIHNHVVRAIMNGAQGEELNTSSPWKEGVTISKTVHYTVPSQVNPDKGKIVVLVHRVESPFYNSEIQQGEKYPLVSPNYVATMVSNSEDVIAENTETVDFTAVLYNEGLLDDTYYIDPELFAPSGWTGEFTTENGTFTIGEIDSVEVAPDDSTVIELSINPNGNDGFGETVVNFSSKNSAGLSGSVKMRNVTTTGVDILLVDNGENPNQTLIDSTFIRTITNKTYGMVSRVPLQEPGVDLSHFNTIVWSAGNITPVFYEEEVNNLTAHLDNGGNLLINGQNIGSDIFEPDGESQFAQSFYNNYLHADYIDDIGSSFLIEGIDGDPISDGIQFVVSDVYDRSPDIIAPFDSDASPLLYFLNSDDVAGIKAETSDDRILYFGFGLEQISDETQRDTLASRSIKWLSDNITVDIDDNENSVPLEFSLKQNFPNPFNPTTRIRYSIPEETNVTLKVYDITGQEIAILVNQTQPAGNYSVDFDAANLSSGVYFYKISAGEFISVKKMSILK